MCSEWKVTTNCVDGEKLYAVYRLRDTTEVDHSGNREFASGFMPDKNAAYEIAAKLNIKEEKQ